MRRAVKKPLRIFCPSKINLFLEVLGRRPDGYHELATVMTPVDLGDMLEVREARRFSLEVEGAVLPGFNTVEKAWRAVRRRRRIPGVRARLVKRTPAGSGLGGGSSDAAAMIAALDRLFDLGLDRAEVGAEIGSDVNFFLQGGPALCTGRGERVHPLRPARSLHLVLAWPGFSLSTPAVYRALRRHLTPRTENVTDFLNIYDRGALGHLGGALFNRLEPAAFDLHPELGTALRRLSRLPFAGARMTGSGSALYGLCASANEARQLARRVRGLWDVFVVPSCSKLREEPWRSPRSASS